LNFLHAHKSIMNVIPKFIKASQSTFSTVSLLPCYQHTSLLWCKEDGECGLLNDCCDMWSRNKKNWGIVDVSPDCVPSNTSLFLIHRIFHVIKGVMIPFSVTTFCITFKRFNLYALRNLIWIIRKSHPPQIDTTRWKSNAK